MSRNFKVKRAANVAKKIESQMKNLKVVVKEELKPGMGRAERMEECLREASCLKLPVNGWLERKKETEPGGERAERIRYVARYKPCIEERAERIEESFRRIRYSHDKPETGWLSRPVSDSQGLFSDAECIRTVRVGLATITTLRDGTGLRSIL